MPVPVARSLLLVALAISASRVTAQAFTAPSFVRPTWTSAQSFTTIVGVRETADGSVFVADYAEPAVHLLAPGGQRARVIGRKGSGPREYLMPWRMVALPADSTMLIDTELARYLVIAPGGAIVATTPFPEELTLTSQYIRGSDRGGRIYFQPRFLPADPTAPKVASMLRWDRKTNRVDSVGTVRLPAGAVASGTMPDGTPVQGMRTIPFAPTDAWTVAPDGRIAVVIASPYHVEWREVGRPAVIGQTIPFTPVPVTVADKKAREPKGPPFLQAYPATKPAFTNDAVVLDDRARLWIGRSVARGAKLRQWDVVDSQGKLLTTLAVPTDTHIITVTARFVYAIWKDGDDVEWLRAFAR